ncbi:hypothetical protein Tco_1186938, partial [Tanacetum coccineum]
QCHTKRLSVDPPTLALCQRAFPVEAKVYVTYLITEYNFLLVRRMDIDYAASAVLEDESTLVVPEDESASAVSEDESASVVPEDE